MGLSRIFRSRWSAVFWAAGIIWTAYDVAEATAPQDHAAVQPVKPHARPTDATGEAVDDHDLQILAKFAGG